MLAFYMLRGAFGLRHIPDGVRRAYRSIKARLAKLAAEDAKAAEEAVTRPADITLH
jgi:hypothetical protein